MRGVPFLERITIAAFFASHFAGVRKNKLNEETVTGLTVTDRIAVEFGGRVAAVVSLPNPATVAEVKNEAAFLAHVKKTNPDAVEKVERVRPDTQRKYLADAVTTGEKIPGVEIRTRDLVPRVELADDAADVIAEAWARGEIREEVAELLRIVPALPAGGGQDAS